MRDTASAKFPERGFTLLEVILVVALIATVALLVGLWRIRRGIEIDGAEHCLCDEARA
jgi:prepilin-type N-terminal cleavage/methylation domain-containing protein